MHRSSATDIGKVSARNEDSYLVDLSIALWIVSDGLGGHERGDVASRIAVDTIANAVRGGATLVEALTKAHEAVLAHGGDMAATAVVLKLDGNQYEIVWVGDSRAYLFHEGLHQLTRDHTYIQRLVDEGEMTAEEAQHHPERSFLTQALGSKGGIAPETVSGKLNHGDKIMLCSDGLTDEVDEAEILAIGADAARLVQAALNHGGRDNVTVVVAAPDTWSKNSAKNCAFQSH